MKMDCESRVSTLLLMIMLIKSAIPETTTGAVPGTTEESTTVPLTMDTSTVETNTTVPPSTGAVPGTTEDAITGTTAESTTVPLTMDTSTVETNTTVPPSTATAVDPCISYSSLDEPWRATNNSVPYDLNAKCDINVNWGGWYRLFYNGMSVQMPEWCPDQLSCGTHAPLWLQSSHPHVGDGEVTRNVCGHWNNDCCLFRPPPITVKACPGNYYVYKFVSPISCYLAYCADLGPVVHTTPNTALSTTNPTSQPASANTALSTTTPTTQPASANTALSTTTLTTQTTAANTVIGLRVIFTSVRNLTETDISQLVLQPLKQELNRRGVPSDIILSLRYVKMTIL
ncbi:pancreatic secretory granule membrane major glycoprotein GP2-like isoform X2 [Denticeps clupeoides]|uniref:pancreatic secretory granule membrane major glycoprotein GP2-like isoform X2 n=1 Tax=Denticeps clupeoides TaxID=299321 RepID=UPI0010A2F2AC|nr:pancreatic secretory granule membrane major glycoprotein GP2-like isoform X2 [Denticeps clupeoides]